METLNKLFKSRNKRLNKIVLELKRENEHTFDPLAALWENFETDIECLKILRREYVR